MLFNCAISIAKQTTKHVQVRQASTPRLSATGPQRASIVAAWFRTDQIEYTTLQTSPFRGDGMRMESTCIIHYSDMHQYLVWVSPRRHASSATRHCTPRLVGGTRAGGRARARDATRSCNRGSLRALGGRRGGGRRPLLDALEYHLHEMMPRPTIRHLRAAHMPRGWKAGGALPTRSPALPKASPPRALLKT